MTDLENKCKNENKEKGVNQFLVQFRAKANAMITGLSTSFLGYGILYWDMNTANGIFNDRDLNLLLSTENVSKTMILAGATMFVYSVGGLVSEMYLKYIDNKKIRE